MYSLVYLYLKLVPEEWVWRAAFELFVFHQYFPLPNYFVLNYSQFALFEDKRTVFSLLREIQFSELLAGLIRDFYGRNLFLL